MFDYIEKMNKLISQRFCCSQVITSLALELMGCDDPNVSRALVRAASGLCGGIGCSGKDCGALTGGAMAIGLFCGRGHEEEAPHDNFHKMVSQLVEWFEDEYKTVECNEIVGGDPQKRMGLCPEIMKNTYENAVRIMLENDVEIY